MSDTGRKRGHYTESMNTPPVICTIGETEFSEPAR